MTLALIPWLDPEYAPAKPFEAASATLDRPQPASAPSELVIPVTPSAASSAARARSISTSAAGSSGSSMSSTGRVWAISAGSAMPQYGSSGTVRAIATARSTSAASASAERSVDDTTACCLPTNTLRPRSWPSERSSFSVLPRRRACDSEVPSNSTASAASAPARRARPIRSCSTSIAVPASLLTSGIASPPFPDRVAGPGQPIARPFAGHLGDNLVGHADRPAPFAPGLRGHFACRIEANLAAETRLRRGKVEIVDRGAVHERDIANGVHAGRHRPHDLFPVARINVVIDDDDEFGIDELTQKRPDPHHHALGLARISLADRHHGDAVRTPFRWQPEIDNLGKLLLQQRNEYLVQRRAEDRRLVRWPPGKGREVNGARPHRDCRQAEDREAFDSVVIPGMVAIRTFLAVLVEHDVAFENYFGLSRNL